MIPSDLKIYFMNTQIFKTLYGLIKKLLPKRLNLKNMISNGNAIIITTVGDTKI